MGLYSEKLVEVLRIHFEINRPCNLYGTIMFEDCRGDHLIYKRERADPQLIEPGRTSLLIDLPDKALDGYCRETGFKVDLKHANKDCDDGSADEELCRGFKLWDSILQFDSKFDKLSFARIDGQNSSVEFCFAVLPSAYVACVIVKLVNLRKRPAKVCGRILAGSTWIAGDASREIFFKKEGDGINIQNDDSGFQLCRSIVAVPVNSMLFICADVWGYGKKMEFVRQIGKGRADFEANGRGTSRNIIRGEDCDIEVEVVWSTYR